jgi:amino acid transporter
MRAARIATALISGLLLFSACNLAAIRYAKMGLPRHWYAPLGGRNAVSVMVGEALVIALLLGVIAMVWAFITLKPKKRRHRPQIAWLMWGIGLAWMAWLIYGAFFFALNPKTYSQPLTTLLFNASAPPLFGIFNIVGVVGGAYFGGRWATRVQLSLPSSRRRKPANGTTATADTELDEGPSTLPAEPEAAATGPAAPRSAPTTPPQAEPPAP